MSLGYYILIILGALIMGIVSVCLLLPWTWCKTELSCKNILSAAISSGYNMGLFLGDIF